MKTALKPYPAYRNSGVPWLEGIPEHWELVRGKSAFRCVDVRSSEGKEELLTVSSERGVIPRKSANVTMFKAESYAGYKLCWPGDLVINSLWAWARGLGVSRYHGIVSSAYGVYRLRPECEADVNFVHELMRSAPFQWELQVRSKGIWISRLQLTDEALLNAPIVLPPLHEQVAIARYLGYMDTRFRRYINGKKKLLALLNEQRQAIIHRAVTRGLDCNVGLKPSGVDWLGDIPAHWEVTPLKRIAWFRSGAGFPVVEQGNRGCEIPFIKVSDMVRAGNEAWMEEVNSTVTIDTASRLGAFIFPPGSIIFPKVGGALLTNKRRLLRRASCIDNNVMGCVVSGADLRYAFVVLQQLDFGRLAKPGPVPAITEGDIGTIRVGLPPMPEQLAITLYLDKATSDINAAIKETRREMELLCEYRTRLVSDVVTGQLDVRELAASLEEESAGSDETDEEIDRGQMLVDEGPELIEEAGDADD